MPSIGSTFLKLLQTLLYAVLLSCSGIILGIYSYFLALLARRPTTIATWEKAVEGLSGAAVAYTILAVILTCCLGGVRFFASLAIVLDVLFCGAMIAIAVLTRGGAGRCTGIVDTPPGSGPASRFSNLALICRLNRTAFAVSIVAAVLFLVCAGLQLMLARRHQRDRRYGPSPANGYTSGSKLAFWKRRSSAAPADAERDSKPSYETGYSAGHPAGPTGGYAAPQTYY